jgi:hypothetical protein
MKIELIKNVNHDLFQSDEKSAMLVYVEFQIESFQTPWVRAKVPIVAASRNNHCLSAV